MDTFADAVARANHANEELLQGRAGPLKALFSHRDDIVQLERGEVRYRGVDAAARLELRVTMLFRREDGEWRLVSRHADEQVEKKSPVRKP